MQFAQCHLILIHGCAQQVSVVVDSSFEQVYGKIAWLHLLHYFLAVRHHCADELSGLGVCLLGFLRVQAPPVQAELVAEEAGLDFSDVLRSVLLEVVDAVGQDECLAGYMLTGQNKSQVGLQAQDEHCPTRQ